MDRRNDGGGRWQVQYFLQLVDLVRALLASRAPNPNGIKGSRDHDRMDGTVARVSSATSRYALLSDGHSYAFRHTTRWRIPDGFSHSRRDTYASRATIGMTHAHVLFRDKKRLEKKKSKQKEDDDDDDTATATGGRKGCAKIMYEVASSRVDSIERKREKDMQVARLKRVEFYGVHFEVSRGSFAKFFPSLSESR